MKENSQIWHNGDIIPWQHMNLHISTHAIYYAGSVWEGIKVYSGIIFKLEEHINRLFQSAKLIGINIPFTKQQILDGCNTLVKKNNVNNGYIRPIALRGSGNMTVGSQNPIQVIIMCYNLQDSARSPLKLCISKWRKAPDICFPNQAKASGNYQNLVSAKHEAQDNGFDDALMLDLYDNIAECTTSNIFFVRKDDVIVTPFADYCLKGITRGVVMDLRKVEEQIIRLDDIENFKEAFCTGTAIEIRGIKSITLESKTFVFESFDISETIYEEYKKCVG